MSRTQASQYKEFIDSMIRDLTQPLPGEKAQYTMAPNPRRNSYRGQKAPADADDNGVLILLYPHHEQLWIPLILRPEYPGVHSGQISLPGGREEDVDATLRDTALREAHEEIGVPPQLVQILGKLTPLYVGASNNLVHPFVGWVDHRPHFVADEREVAELVETPLHDLLNLDNCRLEMRRIYGNTVEVPFYAVCNQIVWGATAMIFGEFLNLPSIREWEERERE